ncbi:hypothetical protein LSH36_104g05055, partial [Paralvinella palmiformis]
MRNSLGGVCWHGLNWIQHASMIIALVCSRYVHDIWVTETSSSEVDRTLSDLLLFLLSFTKIILICQDNSNRNKYFCSS